MTAIGFYHLLLSPLEKALPKLLEKALEKGMRALVVTGSRERAEHLDTVLWTYEEGSFLPHGCAGHAGDVERQPIWLSEKDDSPNHASLLVLVDGADSDRIADFERVVDMFDGHDSDAVASARRRWKARKDAGYALTYWQQTPRGTWEKKAESAS